MSDNITPKPNDINDILLNAQDVIDAATETIKATRETQTTLEYNIATTDKKISAHNGDAESHPDIRVALEDMPPVITDPVISGVTSIENGTEGSWSLQAEPSPLYAGTVKVTRFNVYGKDGSLIATVPAENNQGTFTYTFTGSRNEQIYFEVQALAAVGETQDAYKSKRSKYDLTIIVHLPPDLSNMSCTIPSRITEGHTYTFRIGNVIDLDGDLESITISCKDVHITFSETTIKVNTDYTLTVEKGYNGPADILITFTAYDAWGLSASRDITVKLDTLPIATGFTHTFPTLPNANSTYRFIVDGITDPDDDVTSLTCDLSVDNPEVTFPKSTGILLGEGISVNIGNLAPATPFNITCTFKDSVDGRVTTTIPVMVNTPPDMSAFVCTQIPRHKPSGTSVISFSGATDLDKQAITYEIINTNPVLTFSKTKGIVDDEEITVAVSKDAIHGQTYNITVNGVDASNGKTPVTVGIIINSLPDLTNVITTLPTYVAPGKLLTGSFTGATDVDAQALTYTITSTNPDVILANNTGIAAGAEISITPPTAEQLARGSTFDLVVTVSDGLETNTKTFIFHQNQLPTTESIVTTMPGSMEGGTEHAVNFIISGGVEPDTQAVTYNIVNASVSLTFSKLTGIAQGESITVSALKATENTPVSFDITATDTVGETSSTMQTINSTIVPIVVTAPPTITSPTDGAQFEYDQGVDVVWSEFATMIDTDNDHAYPWN